MTIAPATATPPVAKTIMRVFNFALTSARSWFTESVKTLSRLSTCSNEHSRLPIRSSKSVMPACYLIAAQTKRDNSAKSAGHLSPLPLGGRGLG